MSTRKSSSQSSMKTNHDSPCPSTSQKHSQSRDEERKHSSNRASAQSRKK